jgi:hypothetical protein
VKAAPSMSRLSGAITERVAPKDGSAVPAGYASLTRPTIFFI